jgi:hypothetical protein
MMIEYVGHRAWNWLECMWRLNQQCLEARAKGGDKNTHIYTQRERRRERERERERERGGGDGDVPE